MKHLIEAGSDGASICIWDPGTLPDDFDSVYSGGSVDMLDRLSTEERIFWQNTGGDGEYLLHVLEEELIPQSLEPFLKEVAWAKRFPVPTGQLFCSGTEFIAKAGEHLAKVKGGGGSITLQPGYWSMRLYQADYSKEKSKVIEAQVRRALGFWGITLERLGCASFLMIFIAVIGGFIVSIRSSSAISVLWTLIVSLGVVAAAYLFLRSESLHRATQVRKRVEREWPTFVLVANHLSGP